MWDKAKTLVREISPGLYSRAQRVRDQVSIEYRVLKQIGARGLLQPAMDSKSDWRKSLPVQEARRVRVPLQGQGITDARSFPGFDRYASGGHAVYLSPAEFRSGALSELAHQYPGNAGIKVVRRPGDVISGGYVFGGTHSQLQIAVMHGHRHLMLVANRLHAAGVGPRVLDLLELDTGGKVFTAYVVEHCSAPASQEESERVIGKLKQLVASGQLDLVAPDGFAHADFAPPDYAGNVRKSADGQALFLDFQNFRCGKYGKYLAGIAGDAAEATHFGDRSILRGGRYLYQSVPGVGRGKRDISARMKTIDELLATAGVNLEGRVVFDFGCNIGMMIAEYLRRKALWTHGWDMPSTTPHTEKLLLGIGCTRFSLSARRMEPASPVEEDIPEWLGKNLDGLVISYLAVNGHFGWLDALGRLPWSYLIYEGHETDVDQGGREAKRVLAKLAGARIAAESYYRDGDSRARYVALFARD